LDTSHMIGCGPFAFDLACHKLVLLSLSIVFQF